MFVTFDNVFHTYLKNGLKKYAKEIFQGGLFLKSALSILTCTWTGWINMKIFFRYHINYLSIGPFMCQNKIKSTPILKLAMFKNSINKFVIKIHPIFRLICQKHHLLFKKLGTYVYLSLYQMMKGLVSYKYSSRIIVLLGIHCHCCIEL